MIRAEVNAGEFLKSILNVKDFPRKYKCNHYFINAGDPPVSTGELECMTWDVMITFTEI